MDKSEASLTNVFRHARLHIMDLEATVLKRFPTRPPLAAGNEDAETLVQAKDLNNYTLVLMDWLR